MTMATFKPSSSPMTFDFCHANLNNRSLTLVWSFADSLTEMTMTRER